MDLHPAADPFWRAVRRRHPDVDLALLPPEPPPAAPTDEPDAPADDAVDRALGDARAAVDEAAGALWPPLVGVSPPRASVGFGTTEGTVVVRVRASARHVADPALLGHLRELLDQQGWRPRRAEGEVARLTGRRDGLRLRASYAAGSGAFLVEIASTPLEVGTARAAALAGSGGRR